MKLHENVIYLNTEEQSTKNAFEIYTFIYDLF